MQSVPLLPAPGAVARSSETAPATRVRARSASAAPAASPASAVATATAPSTSPATLRRGQVAWNPSLHRQLSDAQQAQDFLDQTAAQLQSLKTDLSAKLAGLQVQDGQIEAKLQQLSSAWRARSQASSGSLDAQLRYSSPAPAMQRFSVRGLDLRSLQSGGAETLTLSVGGASQGLTSVSITPGLSADEIVKRFDQALAPAGIRVSSDDSGALIFSVAESSWPAVRDSLSIKGDGIRFPTGQLNRVRTDPEPAAMQPDTWQANDAAALRRTLQQVVQALDRVKQARAVVSRALAEAANQIDRAQPRDDTTDAAALANSVQSALDQPGYSSFSAVSGALVGISRTRVLALLSLPVGGA